MTDDPTPYIEAERERLVALARELEARDALTAGNLWQLANTTLEVGPLEVLGTDADGNLRVNQNVRINTPPQHVFVRIDRDEASDGQ